MKVTHIPIVMATDDNYIPLVVSLTSLAENARENTFYDIYILINDSFSQESEFAIKRYLSAYKSRCSLFFKSVGTLFDNALINIPHTTSSTYFRLAIPELLKEDKCIYLDTDTIVMEDLKELFDICLENYYVAGVWHPGVVVFEWENAICRNAKIPNASQYINAGVLVMNLEELRRDRMVKTFFRLMQQNMPSQDQDIINHACYGKIRFIPFKYNVITKLGSICFEDYKECYPEAALKEAWNNPSIIHYADRNKPWNSGDCVFMEQWWYFCKKNLIYRDIVPKFFEEFVTNVMYHTQRDSVFTKKVPQMFDIAFKRKYVIYGAGKMAAEFILFMKRLNINPEFLIVSNTDENPSEVEGVIVKSIQDVSQTLYDKSIVIAVRENLHKEVIENLEKYDYMELLPVSDSFLIK